MNQPNDNHMTSEREQIAAHIDNALDCTERLAEISARIDTLRSRAAALADETGLDKSLAELAESERLVAAAVASGEAQSERAALDRLKAARKAVETKRTALSEQAGLVAALESEAATLDKEAERVSCESQQHRKQAFMVIGDILFLEWKQSVAALFAVGAKMHVARSAAGQYMSGFTRLEVPSFDAHGRHLDNQRLGCIVRDVYLQILFGDQ